MSEYTLAQMLDKLGRNPNLKFKYVGEKSNKVTTYIPLHLSEDGYVVNEEGESILSNFTLNSRFMLVNEPVDRVTAFRAFEQGKTIHCELNGIKCTFIPIKTTFTGFSIEQILHGKWFIGEGE